MVKVKNLHGQTDCTCCDSWIDHWSKHTHNILGRFYCRCCKKFTADSVGGHVIKVNGSDKNRYIVPLCKACNQASNDAEFDVELDDLVWVRACYKDK